MSSKSVVYTTIFGDYDKLIDPVADLKGIKCICFTDNENIKSNIWDVRVIKPHIPGDSCRSARYVKINAHLFLSEFEHSMYIDGNMLLKSVPDIPTVLDGHKFSMEPHRGRDCVYDEADACKLLEKDNSVVLDEQIRIYKELGYPSHAGLYGSGIHFKAHNDPSLIDRCSNWWEHVARYSMRDQISFPVAFYDYPIKDMTVALMNECVTITTLHPCLWKFRVAKL